MKRLEKKFQELRNRNEKGLIAYLTAGDPSLSVTEDLSLALAAAGVDILEIGMPFSDPTADGPVIQDAARRALKNGVTLEAVLEMIAGLRRKASLPIVLFGYYNPLFAYGIERFAAQAKRVGVDGILIVDLPYEEAPEVRRFTDPWGIDFINLIAPTTDDARIKKITSRASGFLYYVSVTGITGTIKPQVADIQRDVARIRLFSNLPVAVGFGISTPEQAAEIAPHAEAIVVGSAFVQLIAELSGRDDLVAQVARFARDLRKSLAGHP